ncbi:DsrE family protein [Pseudidiomarina sp. E22-M8]|uniref:DsrE family protein n=1 Tax=Pseudidiomarina sp. E22-M8 TaxID=3424768 RepID=UPI00403C1E32
MTVFIVQSQKPDAVATWHGQDMLLALATLELNPQLVLLGEALSHLLSGHDAQRQQRSLQKRYALMDLYDCPPPLVATEELAQQQLSTTDFVCDVQAVSYSELSQLLATSTKVLRF